MAERVGNAIWFTKPAEILGFLASPVGSGVAVRGNGWQA